MDQEKPQHHMTFGTLMLVVLFAGLTLFVASIARANPVPDGAASGATFRTKCAMCHGQDGSGSTVGKSMNVPDLRSPAVQKLPDAQLAQIISDGKGGDAFFQGFTQPGSDSLLGDAHSLSASKEIDRTLHFGRSNWKRTTVLQT